MRFWDTSALIPLLVDEPARGRLLAMLEEDGEVLAWWGTPVEIASALARREREQLLTPDQVTAALAAARALAASWHEIVPSDAVRPSAERLLRTPPRRVRGRSILDWALGALPPEVDRVLVVVHYLADQIESYLRTHPLRAADALQLAAALAAADHNPASLEIVCLDERLRDAARREGFSVLSP